MANVRATLGRNGPTDIDQWAWLLDVYAVPWYSTWSQDDIGAALRKGHPIVIATWMGALSAAGDYEVAWAQNSGWQGRYDSFSEGHAMLIVGVSDDGASYLVHDPNVFPGEGTGFYSDGSPKGMYRKYSAPEIWWNVATYASGLGLAIVPYSQSLAPAKRIKRVKPDVDGIFTGPGGGVAPAAVTRSTEPTRPQSEFRRRGNCERRSQRGTDSDPVAGQIRVAGSALAQPPLFPRRTR